MFKEENIELGCKLFCFLVFFAVISFLTNVYSLLFLFLYFFIANSKKQNSFFLVVLYLLTLLGVALAFVNHNLFLLKLFLIFDYGYYFICFFKVNKQSFFVKKNDFQNNVGFKNNDDLEYDNYSNDSYYDSDEIVVNNDRFDMISNELKKGNLLKDDDIDLIKSHLDNKEQSEIETRDELNYLRFSDFKSKSNFNLKGGYKWQFNLDDINGIYIMCHLVILILAIVVE